MRYRIGSLYQAFLKTKNRSITTAFLLIVMAFASPGSVWSLTLKPEGVMKAMITACKIESDSDFGKILKDLDHLPQGVAPPELRSLVAAAAPFRMSLDSGCSWKKGKLSLYWWVNEFGVKKSVSVLNSIFEETLKSQGFSPDKGSGTDRLYIKQTGDYTRRVRIDRIERFIGTSTPSSGGAFLFEIEYAKEVGQPSLALVLAEYPALRCGEMLPEIMDFLRDKPVTNVGYGGTWRRYYDFSVDTLYKNEKEAEAGLDVLVKIAASLGFSLDRDDNGVLTYMKEGSSGPVLYLSLEKDNIVNFRIQPFT
jgi:hypothetical protein